MLSEWLISRRNISIRPLTHSHFALLVGHFLSVFVNESRRTKKGLRLKGSRSYCEFEKRMCVPLGNLERFLHLRLLGYRHFCDHMSALFCKRSNAPLSQVNPYAILVIPALYVPLSRLEFHKTFVRKRLARLVKYHGVWFCKCFVLVDKEKFNQYRLRGGLLRFVLWLFVGVRWDRISSICQMQKRI